MPQFVGSGGVNVVSSETPISDSFEGMCGNFGVAALHRKKKFVSRTARQCEGKPNEWGHCRVKKLNLGARSL